MKKIGIYIHIPFCRQKCKYCAFVSFCNLEKIDKYIDCLCKEIIGFRASEDCCVDTIYIGGGTPSLLKQKHIKKIFDALHTLPIANDCEISIESNPNSVTQEIANCWAKNGINRVSIGLQSASKKVLKTLGRIHSVQEFERAVKYVHNAGIHNINADMMIGVPHQSVRAVRKTVKLLNNQNVTHISAYSLIVEENTPMKSMLDEKIYKLPKENTVVKMYDKTCKMLGRFGFERYEISNFAKAGYECKHNLHCWQCHEYVGFGVAAHSYFENERYSNVEDIDKYVSFITKNESVKENIVKLTNADKIEEYIMLGMRTKYGIDLVEMKKRFGYDLLKDKNEQIKKYQALKLIDIKDNILSCTSQGFYVSNSIIADLI